VLDPVITDGALAVWPLGVVFCRSAYGRQCAQADAIVWGGNLGRRARV